jgi:EAL domain-containing protein (putative c-di-GMP-specific phosphodiesterase class I)
LVDKRNMAQGRYLDKSSQRLIIAYKAVSITVALFCLLWAVIFALHQHWQIVFLEILGAIIALVSWQLIGMGRLNAVLIISELAFLIIAIVFCLMFDVPDEKIPRVVHLFLPVLAMLGYINFLRRKSMFQVVVIVASLSSFVVFASTHFALPAVQTIPNEIRVFGAWFNSIFAVTMMCGCVYALQREFSAHSGIKRELTAAVRNNDLQLFFQPQVDRGGAVVGAEALLRWKHPQRGYITPGEFITIAEECGLMPLIGGWVLKDACNTLAKWREDPHLSKLTLAVNVSAIQFMAEDFEKFVLETVHLYRADPTKLKLELTESVTLAGIATVAKKMNTLREAGITFALDDFGTGYSSLSYLGSLPIHQLKIDRSFVQAATDDPQGAKLIKSIVKMGLDLGIVVLAEGVETAEQRAFLLDCGCQEFQGYYFGHPVPIDVFEHDSIVQKTESRTMP